MSYDKENISSDIILYSDENGNIKVEVLFREETFWLNQKKIAELFQVDRTVITKHLKNIFAEKELNENLVSAKIAHTAGDGKTYSVQFYNLDAIIAVVTVSIVFKLLNFVFGLLKLSVSS